MIFLIASSHVMNSSEFARAQEICRAFEVAVLLEVPLGESAPHTAKNVQRALLLLGPCETRVNFASQAADEAPVRDPISAIRDDSVLTALAV